MTTKFMSLVLPATLVAVDLGLVTTEAIAMSAFGVHVNITMPRKKGFPDGDS